MSLSTPFPTSPTMTMQPGIVHDGCTIRFMRHSERALWKRKALPAEWVVIVPPSADDAIIRGEEVPHDNQNSRGDLGQGTDGSAR